MIRKAKTENGWVAGIPAADPRITAFKGVPFAAPPVGENRWRAPQPAADWEGVRKCYTFAPISVQDVPGLDPDNLYSREWNVDPDIPMSEDCLYLNIWTPAKSADEKLPVLGWFFGGGLVVGNTAEMEFDGERIARRGVIVVSVNYRLNVFGFLCHPQLLKEQPDAPTNFGHLDQRFGIEWAKRNAAAFGGDPDNITIGGQSMGGYSVAALVASPQCRGLFQKAIIESGYWQFYYTPQHFGYNPLSNAEAQGVRFFEHIGVKSLAEARALDPFELRERAKGWRGMGGTVTDGCFLTDDVNAVIERGDALHIPILLGNTGPEFHDAPVAAPKPGMPSFMAPRAETVEDFEAINAELRAYSDVLASRTQIVAANKCDLLGDDRANIDRLRAYVEAQGYEFFEMSAAAHTGTRELIQACAAKLAEIPPVPPYEADYVPPEPEVGTSDELQIRHFDDLWVVEGPWLQRLMGTINFGDYESRMYFDRVLRQSGLFDRLEAMGIEEGDTVSIYDLDFEFRF